MPINVFQRTVKETPAGESNLVDSKHLFDHPLQKLLDVPSGYRPGAEARGNFWRNAWLDFLLYDRVCLVKIRNPDTDNPIALVRIPAVWYTPFGQDYWRPHFIRIIGNRKYDDIPIEDVVYMRGYDPVDPRVGVSPMQTLKTILEEEAASNAWRRRFWENGAQPSMVITRPVEAPDWEDNTRDRFIESLRAAANRGRPLMLEEGMTASDHGTFDPATAQFVESKKLTREEVLRAYNMPPGLFENTTTTSSSMAQYRAMLYAETLAPPLSRFTDELEDQLLTEYASDPYSEGMYLQAMIEEKMRGNVTEMFAMVQSAVGGPFLTRDEGRAILEYPSLASQNADQLIVPINVSVGGEPAAARVTETVKEEGKLPAGPLGSQQASPGAGKPGTAKQPANQNGPAKPPSENEIPEGKSRTKARSKAKLTSSQKAFLLRARAQHAKKATQLMQSYAKRQQSAVGSSTSIDRSRWDKELSDDLFRVGLLTATYFGTHAAEQLGGKYDEEQTYNYLRAGADTAARHINEATEAQLKADGADPSSVFSSLHDTRAPQIGEARTTTAMSFGTEEAARQNGLATKTWTVMNDNPRQSHADLDGETVQVDQPFSNGMMYPGDPAGGPDEVSGCDCILILGGDESGEKSMEYEVPETETGTATEGDDPTNQVLQNALAAVILRDRAPTPDVKIYLPEIKVPDITVTVPDVHFDVNVPPQPAPIIHVEQPDVHVAVEPADVHVSVEAPNVTVSPPEISVTVPEQKQRTRTIKRVVRDAEGRIQGIEEEDE